MADGIPLGPIQQFEQAMATVYTCRGIIKYQTALNETQKAELLADIDTTLRFLRDRIVVNTAIEVKSALPPLPQAKLLSLVTTDNEQNSPGNDAHTLRALHQLYHTYASSQQSNIQALTLRFSETMNALNEIEHSERATTHHRPLEYLQYARAFIADLYYLFMEFMHTLAGILENSDVAIDTEEISSLYPHPAEGQSASQAGAETIAIPASRLHAAQQQLNTQKVAVTSHISDAAAFLAFLEEGLGQDFDKRPEIIAELHKFTQLLHDLSCLLTDYDHTLALLLDP